MVSGLVNIEKTRCRAEDSFLSLASSPLASPLSSEGHSSSFEVLPFHGDYIFWGVLVDRVGRELYISAGLTKKDYFPLLVLHSLMQGMNLEVVSQSAYISFCSGFALCSHPVSRGWFKALGHSKLIEVSHKRGNGTFYRLTEKGLFKLDAILYALNQRAVQRAEYWSAYLDERPIRRELFRMDRDMLRARNPQKVAKLVPEMFDNIPQF
jgi:hypothetical protein